MTKETTSKKSAIFSPNAITARLGTRTRASILTILGLAAIQRLLIEVFQQVCTVHASEKDRDFNHMGYRKTAGEGICCRVGIYFLK
jgi:hypothetical protein